MSGTLKSIFQSWCCETTSMVRTVALAAVTSSSTRIVVRSSQTRNP